jgi:hypothetical protein
MPKPNRLIVAKESILSTFSKTQKRVYSKEQLATVLDQYRRTWHLRDHTTSAEFISFLIDHGNLRICELRSDQYGRKITRYSWGQASALELAASINARGYLSHSTAADLHGLIRLSAKIIYLNIEQSAKLSNDGTLTQDGIDRAFSGKQRLSNLIYTCAGTSVIIISGKNTNRLGVEEFTGAKSELLQITNLERTLIDITVRPAYAGGTSQVLKAYRTAKNQISVDRLVATLKKLDYLYPYHQAIGFLMQKAGYPEKSCAKLRTPGLTHDFYLTHGLHEPEYSKDWRVYYPKDI